MVHNSLFKYNRTYYAQGTTVRLPKTLHFKLSFIFDWSVNILISMEKLKKFRSLVKLDFVLFHYIYPNTPIVMGSLTCQHAINKLI